MSNFDTINAITDNLEIVLKGLGIFFTSETFDDIDVIPASILPHGQIFYERETFEYTFGQKPEYATAEFKVRVVFMGRDARDLIRNQQRWAHSIRDAMTVNALNINALAASKLVSLVTVDGMDAINKVPKAEISCKLSIRYREI